MKGARIIMHVDMDAFFASVEQRDFPELQGKPVVVGGRAEGRGVVAAASYEARQFGVRSAMPMSKALRLCPQAIRQPTRMEVYREVSQAIQQLFRQLTPCIEPLSLDEAYLDISEALDDFDAALAQGQWLKQRIRNETQLTASVGIGPNKFIAKVASDARKPDGLCMVKPSEAPGFLAPLRVRVIPGVGPKSEQRLTAMGIETVGDLRQQSETDLQQLLGSKHGTRIYELARGRDDSPVRSHRQRKSLSQERTFPEDIADEAVMHSLLRQLAEEVAALLQRKQLRGRTVGIKVRFSDFSTATRAYTLDHATCDADEIIAVCSALLKRLPLPGRAVRLLGVRVAGFQAVSEQQETADSLQLRLW